MTVSERHISKTQLNVSVGFKLTVARFINSSLILVIININFATRWFDAGGLVYDASVLMILMAISEPIVYVLNPPGWIKKAKICYQMSKGEDCKLTQQEANTLCEGPMIDVANVLSQYFSMVATCIFFAPIIPMAIPLAFVGSILNYYAFKYMLLRVHKAPEMLAR